jgi:pimeloyl-ACP methyl ester carboxylesterase
MLFKETLEAFPLTYREGNPEDLVISECLTRISAAIQNDPHAIFIGSSLGGFLGASIALTHPTIARLILLNPAIIPPETDLRTIRGIPPRILKEMINPRLFKEKIPAAITILRGIQDDVVPDDWIVSFAQAQQATIQLLNDDHQFSKNLQKLPGIISELLRK